MPIPAIKAKTLQNPSPWPLAGPIPPAGSTSSSPGTFQLSPPTPTTSLSARVRRLRTPKHPTPAHNRHHFGYSRHHFGHNRHPSGYHRHHFGYSRHHFGHDGPATHGRRWRQRTMVAIVGLEGTRLLCSSAGTSSLATGRVGGRSGGTDSRSTLIMRRAEASRQHAAVGRGILLIVYHTTVSMYLVQHKWSLYIYSAGMVVRIAGCPL